MIIKVKIWSFVKLYEYGDVHVMFIRIGTVHYDNTPMQYTAFLDGKIGNFQIL